MDNDLEEFDLDLPDYGPEAQKRSSAGVWWGLFALILAAACAVLGWLYNEQVTENQKWRTQAQSLQDALEQREQATEQVADTLIKRVDQIASEAELHQTQGNRRQALADISRARDLSELAKQLSAGGRYSSEHKEALRKLRKVTEALQLNKEELLELGASASVNDQQHKEVPVGSSSAPPPRLGSAREPSRF